MKVFLKKRLRTLQTKASNEVKLDQDLILLTIFASLLAVYGVKMGNTYVLIGAMLVSPLIDPVISSVIFLVSKKYKKFWIAIRSLLVVLLLAFGISSLLWLLFSNFGQLNVLQYVEPQFTISDTLGVAILSGVVGTLLWIWPKTSNTSAGVAIAISLVPPIANSTLGFVLGDLGLGLVHLLFLLLNLLGIYLGSIAVLWIYVRRRYEEKL